MSKFDFALQWLDFLGNELYNKGERILKYYGNPNYVIAPLTTKIKVGQELGEDEQDQKYTFMGWQDFDKLNYIIKGDSSIKWKHQQQFAFYITRKSRDVIGMSYDTFRKYASRMRIQHDAANKRIRLIGDNVIADDHTRFDSGVGPWIVYDNARAQPSKKKSKPFDVSGIKAAMMGRQVLMNTDSEEDFKDIEEIPIGISPEKYIVCIPKVKFYCQRIIVVGQSGMGKSLFTNAMANRLFYSGDQVSFLIDPMNQFYDLSMPQEVKEFNMRNKILYNEPKPIPAFQLYMASRYNTKFIHKNISMTLTLNFEEFLKKYKFYTYGIKDYDVGATIRYINDYMNELKEISNADKITDIMYDKIPNAHKDKGLQSMIYKWKNTFETIFKENFTSNLYQEDMTATDELEVKFKDGTKMKGHPFIMAMEAGLVPVINVSAARRQRWLRNVLADIMQKVIAHQMEQGDKATRKWIVADELNMIYEKGKRRDNASDAFEEMYRQGRFNFVGFIGNTQSLDKLEKEMYKNANYICCFYMQDQKERKTLIDFKIDKEVYEQIGDLKAQEMMIFRNPEDKFVLYDKFGNRKVIEGDDRRWMKVKIFPPVNHHKVPGEKGSKDEEEEGEKNEE